MIPGRRLGHLWNCLCAMKMIIYKTKPNKTVPKSLVQTYLQYNMAFLKILLFCFFRYLNFSIKFYSVQAVHFYVKCKQLFMLSLVYILPDIFTPVIQILFCCQDMTLRLWNISEADQIPIVLENKKTVGVKVIKVCHHMVCSIIISYQDNVYSTFITVFYGYLSLEH